ETLRHCFFAEFLVIHQVSVVTQSDVHTIRGGLEHRLNIRPLLATRGGVTSMSNAHGAMEGIYDRFIKDIRDQAHVFEDNQSVSITDADTCGFLPTMLQSEQTKVGQRRNIFTRSPDAKNTALFAGFSLALVI